MHNVLCNKFLCPVQPTVPQSSHIFIMTGRLFNYYIHGRKTDVEYIRAKSPAQLVKLC